METDLILTSDVLSKLKEYSETLDKNILLTITNDTVATVLHTIFTEAVRTYNEDLPTSKEYQETHTVTTEFYTEIEHYPKECIFWKHIEGSDPWYVMLTIDDEMDRNIDFAYHNNPKFRNLRLTEDKLLTNILCMMDLYASHANWRYKFVQVVYKCVSECYDYYLKLIEIYDIINEPFDDEDFDDEDFDNIIDDPLDDEEFNLDAIINTPFDYYINDNVK